MKSLGAISSPVRYWAVKGGEFVPHYEKVSHKHIAAV